MAKEIHAYRVYETWTDCYIGEVWHERDDLAGAFKLALEEFGDECDHICVLDPFTGVCMYDE